MPDGEDSSTKAEAATSPTAENVERPADRREFESGVFHQLYDRIGPTE